MLERLLVLLAATAAGHAIPPFALWRFNDNATVGEDSAVDFGAACARRLRPSVAAVGAFTGIAPPPRHAAAARVA